MSVSLQEEDIRSAWIHLDSGFFFWILLLRVGVLCLADKGKKVHRISPGQVIVSINLYEQEAVSWFLAQDCDQYTAHELICRADTVFPCSVSDDSCI